MERQVQDENDTTSAFRHRPHAHARIVRIGLFEETRSELTVIPWLGPEFSCQKRLKSTPGNDPVYNPEIRFDFPYK